MICEMLVHVCFYIILLVHIPCWATNDQPLNLKNREGGNEDERKERTQIRK